MQTDSGCNKVIFASFAGEAKKLVRGAYEIFIFHKFPAPCYAQKNSFTSLIYFLTYSRFTQQLCFALWAGDANFPLALRNPQLLAAAGAFKKAIGFSFLPLVLQPCCPTAQLFKISYKPLVFLVPFCSIAGVRAKYHCRQHCCSYPIQQPQPKNP